MPFVRSGQSELYYETHGDGFPIVFAHGVGGNHASWFHQISDFSSSHRVIVFDHRGFGRSTDVEKSGREAFADDLLALLDEIEIDKAVLVAQSMGGGTCVNFTCQHPERVAGLLLADTLTGCELPPEIRDSMRQLRQNNLSLSQAERVLGKSFRKQNPRMTQLYLELASFNSVNVRTLIGKQPTVTLDALSATNVSVLYVVGEEDILCPPRAVRVVQGHVANSNYAEIPGAGHSAYFEQPDAFNDILGQWLIRLRPE